MYFCLVKYNIQTRNTLFAHLLYKNIKFLFEPWHIRVLDANFIGEKVDP